MESKKDFSSILDAYKFFKTHSNEYEENSKAFVNQINAMNNIKSGMRIFDFGAGDGALLADLYSKTLLHKRQPKFFIYEPVVECLYNAKNAFSCLNYNHLTTVSDLDDLPENSIDLILINHVLYYVNDLNETLLQLMKKLHFQGEIWVILANKNNSLIILWKNIFNHLGIRLPYFLDKDFKKVLYQNDIYFSESKEITSQFECINSENNRHALGTFLFGEYKELISDDLLFEQTKKYHTLDRLSLPLSDNLYMIKKCGLSKK